MSFIRRSLPGLVLGLLLVVGVSYVAAQELTSSGSDEVSLAQAEEGAPPADTPGQGPKRHRLGRFHGAIRGEVVVPGEGDEFRTVRFDRGILQSADGSTLVIEEADGSTVEVPTSDETKFGRDGAQATLEDLEVGDHIFAHRVKTDGDFVTEHVRAISPERYEEMQQRREACRENPERCRAERRQRFRERRQMRRQNDAEGAA